MTMTTIPSISQKRWRAFQRKAVYDHDHHPFPFQKKRIGQELSWGLFAKKKGLSIYCQSCKAWVGWAKVNQKAQPNFMEMDNDGRCPPLQPGPPSRGFSRRTQPSSQKLSSSLWKGKGWWSWPYRAFFSKALLFCWEREGVVVMVIQLSLLEKGRGNGHGHKFSFS